MSDKPLKSTLDDDTGSRADASGPSGDEVSREAFKFVQQLAEELSGGELELPYLPDIAIRIRGLLNDPDCNVVRVARAVSTEPGLAARLLRMANSAQYAPGGQRVTEVTPAINRLGFQVVRNASWTYALSQMQKQEELSKVADELRALWEDSTHIAAMAFVVSRQTHIGHPDEALMAGMAHNVGKVYIQTRLASWEEETISREVLREIVRDWHPAIGRSIAESWELPEEVVEAVGSHMQLDRQGVGDPDLCDVVTIAWCLCKDETEIVPTLPAAQRLAFDAHAVNRLLAEASEELESLRSALAA